MGVGAAGRRIGVFAPSLPAAPAAGAAVDIQESFATSTQTVLVCWRLQWESETELWQR
jgi:hypothetical protein